MEEINNRNKYDEEAKQNFLDRMHSQSSQKLTKEQEEQGRKNRKFIEEYRKKINKEKHR